MQEAQARHAYAIHAAAEFNKQQAAEKFQAGARLHEEFQHQQSVIAELEAARKKRMYGGG